jgi:hypothetical protein
VIVALAQDKILTAGKKYKQKGPAAYLQATLNLHDCCLLLVLVQPVHSTYNLRFSMRGIDIESIGEVTGE